MGWKQWIQRKHRSLDFPLKPKHMRLYVMKSYHMKKNEIIWNIILILCKYDIGQTDTISLYNHAIHNNDVGKASILWENPWLSHLPHYRRDAVVPGPGTVPRTLQFPKNARTWHCLVPAAGEWRGIAISRWWFQPTHLKYMQPSNWITFPEGRG